MILNILFYRNPPKVRLFIRQYISWNHNLMLIQTPSWPSREINIFYVVIYEGEILPHDIQHRHMRHHMHCTWVHIRLLELHIPRHRSYPFLVPNTTNMSADVYSCSHVTTFNSFRSSENLKLRSSKVWMNFSGQIMIVYDSIWYLWVRNQESSFEKLVILYIHAFQLCIHEYNLLLYPL